MTRFLLLIILSASSTASAIVIRDDVDDSMYRIPASEFPALVDMPGEGHGVLIAPQWVITAAHVVPGRSELNQVVINGLARDVNRVIMHSGYKTLPQTLIDQAMTSGEAMLIVVFLASSDDIALVELTQPVTDVAPVAIYKDGDEPSSALPLEGMLGNGDSGGPVLIQIEDQWLLAGLASWKVVQGNVMTARPGRYGQITCNARLSHYSEWIENVMSGQL